MVTSRQEWLGTSESYKPSSCEVVRLPSVKPRQPDYSDFTANPGLAGMRIPAQNEVKWRHVEGGAIRPPTTAARRCPPSPDASSPLLCSGKVSLAVRCSGTQERLRCLVQDQVGEQHGPPCDYGLIKHLYRRIASLLNLDFEKRRKSLPN